MTDATNAAQQDDILKGVRVLDLCRDLTGPFCSMMMAELGADVVEVEHPVTGDETRHWPPLYPDLSGYFASMNRSKRGIAVDLKHPDGLAVIYDLARKADVVMQSFTPGVADRLGVGYEDIRKINPKVIYYSVSGFGHTGPKRGMRGFDPILQAMSGFMSLTGERGRGPVKTIVPVADVSTGIYGFGSIMGALFWRERTGRSQHIDMSMLDAMVSMLTVVGTRYLMTGIVPERNGTENPQRVPSAAFECADGRYLQLVPNQRQWARFSAAVGHPEWVDDPRYATPAARVDNQETLYPLVRSTIKQKSADEWIKIFEAATVACSLINTLEDLFNDPQVRAREMVQHYDFPGVGQVPAIGLPFKYSETPSRIRNRPPRLGEHTEEVLREIGRSPEAIRELMQNKAVRGFIPAEGGHHDSH